MSIDLWQDVRQLYVRFGFVPDDVTPELLSNTDLDGRIRFLQEELDELKDAAQRRHLADMADALVDLVVVALGTAALLGLPWPACWDEVHQANSAKVPGLTKRGLLIDLMKPAGWVPPNLVAVLTRFGYAA